MDLLPRKMGVIRAPVRMVNLLDVLRTNAPPKNARQTRTAREKGQYAKRTAEAKLAIL
jgi:hypothetical protein